MELNAQHMGLANICINLACSVATWPPEVADQLADLQRRFTIIHASLLERQRIQEQRQREEQERAEAQARAEEEARAAVHPQPTPPEFDLQGAIRDAEEQVKQLSRSFSTSRGEHEGMHGEASK